MIFNYHILKWLLPLLAVALLTSCDKDESCVTGEGDAISRVYELEDINRIKVNGSTKVYVRHGAQQQVKINAQPNVLDVINTQVNNGTWTIETTRCLRRRNSIEVFITIPSIEYLEVSGSGRIELQDSFEVPEVECFVNGSGRINASFITEHALTRISGSGNVSLSGRTQTQYITVSGSGSAKAFDFTAENTTVNISGSGNAEVRSNQTLDINISGSGKVYYKGSPTLNSEISGSGKVVKR